MTIWDHKEPYGTKQDHTVPYCAKCDIIFQSLNPSICELSIPRAAYAAKNDDTSFQEQIFSLQMILAIHFDWSKSQIFDILAQRPKMKK